MLIILSYRGQIISISSSLESFYDVIKRFELAAERIFEILEGDKYPKEVFGNTQFSKIEGNISFKNVSFGYEEDDMVLKNISFQIHPNETVSFVGKSGSGKSTIFNRIIGERKSIIEERRGVTRDRIYAKASWLTRDFILIDTGGIEN